MTRDELDKLAPLAVSKLKALDPGPRQQLAPPMAQPQQPSVAQQLGKQAVMSAAKKGVTKLGLKAAGTAAAGPMGGIAAEVGEELLPQLLGSFFNKGGKVRDVHKPLMAPLMMKKGGKAHHYNHGGKVDEHTMPLKFPHYKELIGNKGPLSKVKYKKTGGEITHEYETNYHNPMEAKNEDKKANSKG